MAGIKVLDVQAQGGLAAERTGLLGGRRHGRWTWIVSALVLLAAVSTGYLWLNQPPTASAFGTVERGDVKATVSANARVRAEQSARLAFQSSGLVTQVHVQEGDAVKAGDVLAELRSDEFDRRVRLAELTLSSRQLDLARAQAPPQSQELEIAQANLKKSALALKLAQDNYDEDPSDRNRVARELAQLDYNIAQASFERVTRGPTTYEIQALQNAVHAAQLDLDNALTARAQTQLRAPFAGVVTEVNIRSGELLGGFTPIITLVDLEQLELVADIDEIDVGAVHEGQAVDIRLDAFPGHKLDGVLARLFPAASNDRGATVYRALVRFDAADLQVRPGMGATIKIATVEKRNVLLVPSRAVKQAGSQRVVTVLDGNTRRTVVVETGLSDGSATEIVNGLSEGAQVVLD